MVLTDGALHSSVSGEILNLFSRMICRSIVFFFFAPCVLENIWDLYSHGEVLFFFQMHCCYFVSKDAHSTVKFFPPVLFHCTQKVLSCQGNEQQQSKNKEIWPRRSLGNPEEQPQQLRKAEDILRVSPVGISASRLRDDFFETMFDSGVCCFCACVLCGRCAVAVHPLGRVTAMGVTTQRG